MYYMGCVKITSLATLLSMRLCLQVVLRHVGDIAASRALHPREGWRDQPREDRWQDPPREGDWRDQPREDRPHGNPGLPPLPPQLRRNEDNHQDEGAGGFQEPRVIACILDGAQAPASQCIFKQFAREVNAVLPKLEAMRPLRWSACAITFSSADQLKCAATAGVVPMLCSLVISNVLVTRTLIDGGAGLNVLSLETFDNLQVPYDQLQPTKPFSGVTDGSMIPIGQVCLPVTFGTPSNYRAELIDFDVAHIRLTYNAILGYPALAKFMDVTHHGYNVLKMPGSGGVITVPCEEKDAVCSLERAFQAASLEDQDRGSRRLPEATPKKKKTSSGLAPREASPSGPASAQGDPPSIA